MSFVVVVAVVVVLIHTYFGIDGKDLKKKGPGKLYFFQVDIKTKNGK